MKKEYDRSIADCDKAIELEPKLAVPYNNCCSAYSNKNDAVRAIAYCDKAIGH